MNKQSDKECWRRVKDHPRYSISTNGRAYSHPRWVKHTSKLGKIGKMLRKGRFLKTSVCHNYRYVSMDNEGCLIHRLMAIAFIPNPKNKPCINHIDTHKLNNVVENLEWVTHKENMDHAYKHNLVSQKNKARGINHYYAKLTFEDIQEIRELRFESGFSVKAIAILFDITGSYVRELCNFKRRLKE
jgi:DNA-binding transcriptional regulator YiaG